MPSTAAKPSLVPCIPAQYHTTATWIFASVGSSVSIIVINKALFSFFQFHFVLSLTAMHFFVQFVLFQTLVSTGRLERKAIPHQARFLLAFLNVAGISLMNLNLKVNSVSVYQISKLLCVPFLVCINYMREGILVSSRMAVVLGIILFGVAITSVTDISATIGGSLIGLGGAFVAAAAQYATGKLAHSHNVTSAQLMDSISLPLCCMQCVATYIIEWVNQPDTPLTHVYQPTEFGFILFSCFLAAAVNVSAAGLIKNTSPLTFQVVGHAKTCLLLLSGYLLFASVPLADIMKQLCGIFTALLGVYLYGKLKTGSSDTVCGSLFDCLLRDPDAHLSSGPAYKTIDLDDDDTLLEDDQDALEMQ